MKKYQIIAGVAITTAFLPNMAFAIRNLRELAGLVIDYFNLGVYFIMSLAVLFFVWNVFVYFFKSDGGESKAEAGKYVMYGVIGFFVMLSFWGLVNILDKTFNLDSQAPYIPSGAPNSGDTRGIYDLRDGSQNNNVFDQGALDA